MRAIIRPISLLITTLAASAALAASCTTSHRDGGPDDFETATIYGGVGYAGTVYRFRSTGSVQSCSTGPLGVLLPNRFVFCDCEQLVKDCDQDSACGTCTSPRRERCASDRWFSSVSFLGGVCDPGEYRGCETYCRTTCTYSCNKE
jgi:hypothetical protein